MTAEQQTAIENYIQNHSEEIVEKVNDVFCKKSENIKNKVLQEIRRYLDEDSVHYEVQWNQNHYKKLIPSGTIDFQQTIAHFFEFEYTGSRIFYGTLSDFTREMAQDIQVKTTMQILKDVFLDMDDEELKDVVLENHDIIYDDCYAYKFFDCLGSCYFLKIENMTLEEVINSTI